MPPRFFSRKDVRGGLQENFQGLLDTTTQAGRTATQTGIERSLAFDPSQAVTQFGQGFLDEAREGLGQDFDALAGRAVGSGRLKTGFFQRDTSRLFQDFNRRVSNAIALQSLEASRQTLANNQGLTGMGTQLLGLQTDILGGALDRGTAEDNARGGGFGGFLGGALGTVAGSIGGPIGSAIGNKIGKNLFN